MEHSELADGKIFRDPYNKNGVGAVRYLGIECQRTKREFILKNSTLIQNLIHMQKAKSYMHNTHKQHVPMTDCRLSDVDAVKEPKHRKEKGLDQKPFRSFLGACGYICMSTKPQCSYAFKELARFNTNFGLPHWEALLNLISYIQTTQDEGLIIPAAGGEDITAYSDADWNGSDKHLSTTGWIIFCGDAPISWCSQMQRATARSVCESEYISVRNWYTFRCCRDLSTCHMTMSPSRSTQDQMSRGKLARTHHRHSEHGGRTRTPKA